MRTILVHLAYDDFRHRRIESAVALAARHKAHLVGLYTKSPYVTPPAIVGRGASAVFVREMEASAAENAQDVAAEFCKAIEHAGLAGDFKHQPGDPMDAIAAASRYADLVVVSQTPPETLEDVLTGRRPDHAALITPCPVLIVPHAGGQTEIGKRVLIAWKPTREAARAVRDAIPILHKASDVTILTVEAAEAKSGSGEALAAFLARHGIGAALRPDYGDEDDVGDVILSHARDMSADLVVMGAYGKPHMREVILGGATERVITTSTVHALMSH